MSPINSATAIAEIKSFLLDFQNRACEMLQQEEEKALFLEDQWQYQQGGGGITRVMSDGMVFEKAGVNFSHVQGASLPSAATKERVELTHCPFHALGVSIVAHPKNPYVPTSHMNVRFILVEKNNKVVNWWFGGGFDLTPYYAFPEDCIHWHTMAKAACEPYGPEVYVQFKKWCDEYFYLKHRNEPRGIGGIFFDDLHEWGFVSSFAFMRDVARHYLKAYQPIVAKRKIQEYSEQQRRFQLYRRGRYVEFNLLYDRGTLFGLESGGRTESILMSLPPLTQWIYDWKAIPGSEEEKLLQDFLCAREWV